MSNILKVGDTVNWRGSFGSSPPQHAVVKGMELCDSPRSKHGESVDSVEWSQVEANLVVFDLENGKWAYSSQISRI